MLVDEARDVFFWCTKTVTLVEWTIRKTYFTEQVSGDSVADLGWSAKDVHAFLVLVSADYARWAIAWMRTLAFVGISGDN